MSSRRPSKKRALSAEEAELWAAVMRGTKKHRRKSTRGQDADINPGPPGTSAPGKTSPTKSSPKTPAENPPVSPPRPQANIPPINDFDHRHKRKLSRNVEAIDSRIDLHGMRQIEAFAALRRFLFACAARGDRNVLVITGKGTRGDRDRGHDYMAEERGVLRRLVPQWLREDELRAIVISFTAAGPRHGGDGALYIRIRKLRHD